MDTLNVYRKYLGKMGSAQDILDCKLLDTSLCFLYDHLSWICFSVKSEGSRGRKGGKMRRTWRHNDMMKSLVGIMWIVLVLISGMRSIYLIKKCFFNIRLIKCSIIFFLLHRNTQILSFLLKIQLFVWGFMDFL